MKNKIITILRTASLLLTSIPSSLYASPEKKQKQKVKTDAKKYKTALFIGAAIAAPAFVYTCPLVSDPYIFTATTLAYLYLEKKEADRADKQAAHEKKALKESKNETQVESFKRAAKIYKISSKNSNERAKNAGKAALGFTLAAAAALAHFAAANILGLADPCEINGMIRAATYAVFTFLAMMVKKESEDGAKTYKKRSKVYEELAADLEAKLGAKPDLAYGGDFGSEMEEIQPETFDEFSAGTEFDNRGADSPRKDNSSKSPTGACYADSSNDIYKVDEECKCKQTNTCKKVNAKKFKTASGKIPNYPTLVSTMADNAIKETNSILSGNDSSGEVNYGGSREGLKAVIARLRKDINAKRRREKKPEYDFDKLYKDRKVSLLNDLEKEFNNLSPSTIKKLASEFPDTFGETGDNSSSNIVAYPGKNEKDEEKNDLKVSGPGGVVYNLKNKAEGLEDIKSDESKDFPQGHEPLEDVAAEEMFEVFEPTNDDYEMGDYDISESNKNLFKIISNRYQRSAYQKLFNRKIKQ